MANSRIRNFIRRRGHKSPNYTLYGIIGGIVALLGVAMFVYPRYDRVQDFIRARADSMRQKSLTGGRYQKSDTSVMRGRGKTNSDLRTENEILESERTRTDNL